MTERLHTLFHHIVPGKYPEVFYEMKNAPKFVFGGDVVKFLNDNNAWQSMKALVEAGLAKLPFSEMLVEYAANDNIRWFIHIKEDHSGSMFHIKSLFYGLQEKKICLETENGLVLMGRNEFNAIDFTQKQGAHAAIVAVTMAIFLTNLQGIERQEIVPKASFNKARAAKGRQLVPNYTYVRIGRVYGRDGKPVNAIGGGTVRMHLRSAYNRRQHHGKENALVKMVHIPACIVNYDPDKELAETIRKVKV